MEEIIGNGRNSNTKRFQPVYGVWKHLCIHHRQPIRVYRIVCVCVYYVNVPPTLADCLFVRIVISVSKLLALTIKMNAPQKIHDRNRISMLIASPIYRKMHTYIIHMYINMSIEIWILANWLAYCLHWKIVRNSQILIMNSEHTNGLMLTQ